MTDKPAQCADSDLQSQIAKFMGPTWGPHGSCRPQIGPMLAPWTLLSGLWTHLIGRVYIKIEAVLILKQFLCVLVEDSHLRTDPACVGGVQDTCPGNGGTWRLWRNIIRMTSQWTHWCLNSPASRLFTHPFVEAHIKENIKAPRHWLCEGNSPVTGEFPSQKVSNAEIVSIWWRHYDKYRWLSAKLQWLKGVSNGVTAGLLQALDIHAVPIAGASVFYFSRCCICICIYIYLST